MYKEYMLKCSVYNECGDIEDPDTWKDETFYFDTKNEMIAFVKEHLSIRIISAFKLEKLDNNIFV